MRNTTHSPETITYWPNVNRGEVFVSIRQQGQGRVKYLMAAFYKYDFVDVIFKNDKICY